MAEPFKTVTFKLYTNSKTYTGDKSGKVNAVANYIFEEFGPGEYLGEMRNDACYLFDSERMFIDRLSVFRE